MGDMVEYGGIWWNMGNMGNMVEYGVAVGIRRSCRSMRSTRSTRSTGEVLEHILAHGSTWEHMGACGELGGLGAYGTSAGPRALGCAREMTGSAARVPPQVKWEM